MNAPSSLRTWAARLKPPDAGTPLPQTFRYATPENRWFPLMGLLSLSLLGFSAPNERFMRSLQEVWSVSPLLSGTVALMSILLFSLLPIGFFVVSIAVAIDARRHWKKRIEVTEAGLVFCDGDSCAEVAWAEVMRYRVTEGSDWFHMTHSYVLTTRSGEFGFTPRIERLPVLLRLIAARAPDYPVLGWQEELDTLGDEASRWSSGVAELGQRIYHYRTRTNRAMLGFAFTIPVLSSLVPLMATTGWLPHREEPCPPVVGLLIGLPVGWLLWRYRKARVRTDDRGIYQDTPFGVRAIPWSDVREYGLSGEQTAFFGDLIGPRRRIRFWTNIADVQELMAEIRERAVHAQGSWTRPTPRLGVESPQP